jgi:hypothetical protein
MSDVSVSIGVTGKDSVTGAFAEVGKAGEALGSVFTGMVGSLAALAAGYVSVQGVIEIFKGGLDFAKEFSELSDRTGIASEKLVVLQRAFENNGVAAEDLGTLINKMQKSLEAASDPMSKQAEKIRELGLSVSGLLQLSADEQFAAIAAAVGKVTDPAEKTAIAIELLGKSGGKTLALMNNYSAEMEVASAQTTTLQKILQRSSGAFDNVGDNFTVLSHKLREFGVGLLEPIVESLGVLTSKMANFDAAGFGQQVMNNMSKPIRALLESLASGEWSTALGLIYETTKLNLMKALNELYRWGETASAFLSSIFGELFNSDSYLFNYLRNAFDLLANYISRALTQAMVGIVESLPGMGSAVEVLKYKIETATQAIGLQQDALKNGWEVAAGEARKMVSAAIESADYTYKTSDAIFDVGTQQTLVNKLSDDALVKAKDLRMEAELHSEAMQKIASYADSFATSLTGAADTFKGFNSGDNSLAKLSGLDMSNATGAGPQMYNGYKPVTQTVASSGSSRDMSILADPSISNSLFKNIGSFDLDTQAALSQIAMQATMNSQAQASARRIAQFTAGGMYGAASDEMARSKENQYSDAYDAAYRYAEESGNTDLLDALQKSGGPVDRGGSGSSSKGGSTTTQATTLESVLDYLKAALGDNGDYIKDKLPIAVLS